MPDRPSLHTELYDDVRPDALKGANKDKVAVVTGAARGIGQATSIALAKSGANVAIIDLDLERLKETKEAVEREGVKSFAYAANVRDYDVVVAVFKQISQDLGPVDILVNNAGKNWRRPFFMETFDQYWTGFETNFKGAIICIYQVIHSMMERRQGCIINLASRAGTVTAPFSAAYGAAKAGLIRATAVMQTELEIDGYEDNIHMYALHPGGPRTTIFGIDQDVRDRFPHKGPIWDKFHSMFRADPALPGQVSAFLAAGKGKALRGKYFDCEQNITEVLAPGRDGLKGLYELKVEFLGGLPNDGGAVPAVIEDESQTKTKET